MFKDCILYSQTRKCSFEVKDNFLYFDDEREPVETIKKERYTKDGRLVSVTINGWDLIALYPPKQSISDKQRLIMIAELIKDKRIIHHLCEESYILEVADNKVYIEGKEVKLDKSPVLTDDYFYIHFKGDSSYGLEIYDLDEEVGKEILRILRLY